jgi:hypothetical protein
MDDMASGAKKTTVSFNQLGAALTAFGAGKSLSGLINTVKSLADEANGLAMSLQGLTEISKALGTGMKETTGLAEEFVSRGFMTMAEAATAVKTALSGGLNLEQTRDLINATADAAAYNREAHLGWGEAIVQVMRGIKSGNSELTDAAGITTNLSVMYDRYAKSIGTSAAKLTEAQKVQAAYSEIMAESAIFAGNADNAMQGFTGTQSEFNQTMRTARTELGEAYLPVIEKVLETLTPIIRDFSLWSAENKDVVAGLTAATASTLAMATAVSALSLALRGLGIAMGPVGWVITLLGTVVAGIAAYTAAADTATIAAKGFAAANNELNASLEKTNGVVNADQYREMKSQMEALTDVIERRNRLEAEYATLSAKYDDASISADELKRMFDVGEALKGVNKELESMGFDNVEQAVFELRNMEQQSKKSLGALVDYTRQEMQSNIAAADKVKMLKELSGEYDTLSQKEKMSESDKQRLEDVVKRLKSEYPDLNTLLDEEGRWIIKNTDSLRDYIQGEEDRVNTAINAAKRIIEAEKIMHEERVRLARVAVEKLEEIENKEAKPAPFIDATIGNFMSQQIAAGAKKVKDQFNTEINQARFDINEAARLLDDLSMGIDSFRTPNKDTPNPDDSTKGKKAKDKTQTAEQIAQAAYRASLQALEKRRLLGDLTEQQEVDRLASLAETYKKYDDIWIDAESRRQRILEQMAAAAKKSADDKEKSEEEALRDSFQRSTDWTEQETRRMTLAGETEDSIAQMRMEAWTRVRNRYEKDSEYYKRADSELYRLRLDLMRKTEDAAVDAGRRAKETASTVIKSIEAQKKAELKALDERRKAINDFYDEQADKVDDGERQRERADLVAEIAKYQAATSEKGRRQLADLQEKLRKMDIDDQRRALEDERDEKLAALDEQKADIESWYDELKTLLDDYNGDFIKIYQQTEDERFKAFTSTNAAILAELETFKSEYESIMSGVGAGTTASVVAQMAANAKAWHTADAAGRTRLADENKSLGASIGARYDGSSGKWFGVDGLPMFHTGRDGATGRTFSAGDMLMPDEIASILRRDEYVFTPGQLRSLINGASSGVSGGNTFIERQVIMEVNDPTFEDSIDARALGRTAADTAAAELRRAGYQATGGGI